VAGRPHRALLPGGHHPLRTGAATKIVTITEALCHIIATDENGLQSVTLVPIAVTPRRRDRTITADLFRFDEMALWTYLTATENALSPEAALAAASRQSKALDSRRRWRQWVRG